MLFSTEGIVIKNVPYSETSLISKIYTRKWGLRSYISNSVRNAKGAVKPAMLQLLMPLDMIAYHRPHKDIQRIKELKALFPIQSLYFDITKSGVVMFAAELFHHSVKEQEPNERLFDFLLHFIHALDSTTESMALFPLLYTLRLSAYLGFYPHNNFSKQNANFNLAEGKFTPQMDVASKMLMPPESEYLCQLLKENISFNRPTLAIPSPMRQTLLAALMDYYALHIPDFMPLNSLHVLISL